MKALDALQAIAVARGIEIFNADIWDPPVGYHDAGGKADRWRAAIDDMLRAVGWDWEIPYRGDGDVEWCGIFVGACYAKAGLRLELLRRYFPSTYRLQRYGSYRPVDDKDPNRPPTTGDRRMMIALDETSRALPKMPDGSDVRAGDIMLVGGVATGPGKHVTMIESVDAENRIHTLEGNARGLGPDGKRRQGVILRSYLVGLTANQRHVSPTTYHPRWIIRPAPGDFAA